MIQLFFAEHKKINRPAIPIRRGAEMFLMEFSFAGYAFRLAEKINRNWNINGRKSAKITFS